MREDFELRQITELFRGETVHLPDIACLMITELEPGALEHIKGQVNYDFYESLR